MALDVDGSSNAWNGNGGKTDQKCTAYQWSRKPSKCDKHSTDPAIRADQVDPDRFPFVVIPTAGLGGIFDGDGAARGARFAGKTGLGMGAMGIVAYRNHWTPAFIADGGPFMRLGEGSSRVFEELKITRCKKWNAAKTECVGTGDPKKHDCGPKIDKNPGYPYCNFGVGENVVFIMLPGPVDPDLTPANARRKLCDVARTKLGMTGSSYCEGL